MTMWISGARRQCDELGEWKALRRGWCFGEEQSRMEPLEPISGKIGTHHGGSERMEAAEVKVQSIVAEEMARRGWGAAELE